MKRLCYVMMIALAVYTMQGCNNTPKGVNESADSARSKAPAGGTAQQRAAAPTHPAPKAPMTVDAADAGLVTAIAHDNLAAVSLSVIALQITRDEKIKAFADATITNRNKINDELTAVANKKNVLVPTSVSIDVQQKMVGLSKRSGKDFDKTYMEAMAGGDEKALKLYRDEANNAADADLKAFAGKNETFIQKHLDAIAKIRAGL